MLLRIPPVFALVALLVFASTYADSLDGVYKGTKEYPTDSPDWCTPKSIPLTFHVSGSVITLTTRRSGGQSFSAPVANDGSFKIISYHYLGAGRPSGRVDQEWAGVIKGSRIEGIYNGGSARSGHYCTGPFSASKSPD